MSEQQVIVSDTPGSRGRAIDMEKPSRLRQALEARQVHQVMSQAPFFIVVSVACALIATAIYWNQPEPGHLSLLLWDGLFTAASLMRSIMVLGYRIDPHSHSTHFWHHAILVNALGFGALWGGAGMVINPFFLNSEPSSFAHHALLAALITCQNIAALAAYATHLPAFLAYSLFSLLPVSINLLASGEHLAQIMGMIALLFLGVLIFSGYQIHRMSRHAHWLQSKNEALIHVLEHSKKDMLDMTQKLALEIYERSNAETRLQDINATLESHVRERTRALTRLNTELRRSEQRLTLAMSAAGLGMWDWHIPSDVTYHSNFEQLLGFSSHELKGFMGHLKPLVHPDDHMTVKRALVLHMRHPETPYHACYRMRHRDGRWIWVEDHGRVITHEHGKPARMIGVRRDISAQREQEQGLRLAASVFSSAEEGIFVLDNHFTYLTVNPHFMTLTGYNDLDLIGHRFDDPTLRLNARFFFSQIIQTLTQEGSWAGEFTDYRKDSSSIRLWMRVSAVRDERQRVTHYVGLFTDVSSRQEAEERLSYLNNYDKLTGFANRSLFRDRLHAALQRAREVACRVALIFMDLDRFKQINDTLGHEVGDELLRQVAKRISDSKLGASMDTVARVGGDEFTLIIENYDDRSELEGICERLIGEMKRSFRIGEHELLLGASIGISLFPEHGRDLQVLLNHADIAMHQAKRIGGNTYRFYTEDLRATSLEQLTLETSLRKAIFREEFVVHYQPKMCLSSRRIVGVEALVRWNHPNMGLLTPGEFIPLAEESGLVSAISELVLNRACEQVQFWREAGLGDIRTSVNIAAHQLRKGDLIQIIERTVNRFGIDPSLLELELTESTLMEDAESNLSTLNALRDMGIQLSLDDFGTGYSSLAYLKRFPIDVLKIDQGFIRDIGKSPDDEAITRAIIAMAHSLGMKVVAEGVETEAVLDFLCAEGCDMIQGYFISRPMPEAQVSELLLRQA